MRSMPRRVADLIAAKGRGRDMPVPVLVGSWDTIDGPGELRTDRHPSADRGILARWPHARGRARAVAELGSGRRPRHGRGAHAAAPGRARAARDSPGRWRCRARTAPASRRPSPRRTPASSWARTCRSTWTVGRPLIGVASTIVDVTTEVPRVLREGAVSIEACAPSRRRSSLARSPMPSRNRTVAARSDASDPNPEARCIPVWSTRCLLPRGGSCLLLTPLARSIAIRWGAVARPRDRDVHAVATPRLGGVALFGGFALALLMAEPAADPARDVPRRAERRLGPRRGRA